MDPSAEDQILRDSAALLAAYHRGERAAFITLDERLEQRLPLASQLNAEEQAIVRSLLALPADDRVQRAALESIGPERAHELLETVLRRPIPPVVQVVLEPMVERTAGGVTWLFERLEVGLTGVNVIVRLWADWPADSPFTPNVPRPYLWWTGFSHLADSSGRTLRRASTSIGPPIGSVPLTPVVIDDLSILRYAVRHRAWWRPGIAPDARTVTLRDGVVVTVQRWTGDIADPFVPETIHLGTVQCELGLPARWPILRVPSRPLPGRGAAG